MITSIDYDLQNNRFSFGLILKSQNESNISNSPNNINKST